MSSVFFQPLFFFLLLLSREDLHSGSYDLFYFPCGNIKLMYTSGVDDSISSVNERSNDWNASLVNILFIIINVYITSE